MSKRRLFLTQLGDDIALAVGADRSLSFVGPVVNLQVEGGKTLITVQLPDEISVVSLHEAQQIAGIAGA